MEPLLLRAPAKINLFLRVTGKRADGYHELISLMCPLALYDNLALLPEGRDIRVVCDYPGVPEDETNLVVRAACLFLETARAHNTPAISGLTIHIDKHIPVGAGLGGGSSDAAAVMTALNQLLGKPLSSAELMAMGAQLGADVPFFIHGSPALATGIGERLEPVANLAPWTVLLVYPGVAISTTWVYKNLNLRLTKHEKKLKKFHFDGRIFKVGDHMINDLETVAEEAFPVIKEIKRLLLEHGATGAMMTGSGSTVFGLFAEPERAKSACKALRNNPQSQNWTLYVADLLI